jgi:hypothetical protein
LIVRPLFFLLAQIEYASHMHHPLPRQTIGELSSLTICWAASRNVCKYAVWVTIRSMFELPNKYLFILVIEGVGLEGVGENPAGGWQAAPHHLEYFRLCRRFIFQKFTFKSARVLFVNLCEPLIWSWRLFLTTLVLRMAVAQN